MGVERHIRALLREDARGAETFTIQSPWNSKRKFAAFAYIAEEYGYRYDGLAPGGPNSVNYPSFAFRRLPDAAERATRVMAQYPRLLQRAVSGNEAGRGRAHPAA